MAKNDNKSSNWLRDILKKGRNSKSYSLLKEEPSVKDPVEKASANNKFLRDTQKKVSGLFSSTKKGWSNFISNLFGRKNSYKLEPPAVSQKSVQGIGEEARETPAKQQDSQRRPTAHSGVSYARGKAIAEQLKQIEKEEREPNEKDFAKMLGKDRQIRDSKPLTKMVDPVQQSPRGAGQESGQQTRSRGQQVGSDQGRFRAAANKVRALIKVTDAFQNLAAGPQKNNIPSTKIMAGATTKERTVVPKFTEIFQQPTHSGHGHSGGGGRSGGGGHSR